MQFSELVRRPDTLFTVPEVADALEMSRPSAALIVASGLGGSFYRRQGGHDIHSALISAETLEQLASTTWVTEHPEALVVRVRPARVDPADPGRTFMGWHRDATWSEASLGVGRWWRIREPGYWHGKTLIATIVGFVVHVATIRSHEIAPGGAVAFLLEEPGPEVVEAFHGKRIGTTQGGVTMHLAQTEGWT